MRHEGTALGGAVALTAIVITLVRRRVGRLLSLVVELRNRGGVVDECVLVLWVEVLLRLVSGVRFQTSTVPLLIVGCSCIRIVLGRNMIVITAIVGCHHRDIIMG